MIGSGGRSVSSTMSPTGSSRMSSSVAPAVEQRLVRLGAVQHAGHVIERLPGCAVPIWVAAADAPSVEGTPRGAVALALGSEAHGVSASLRAAAGRSVSVPLVRGVESLNVASAGTILLDRLLARTPD